MFSSCCVASHGRYTIIQTKSHGHPGRAGRPASRMADLGGRETPGWPTHWPKEMAVTLAETFAATLVPVMASAGETPGPAGMPPTLADVARLAGVSSATASRVLTGSARVAPQTRDRVHEAVTRLGYVRNRAARSAQPRRAGSIALVVCEENMKVFADPFFPRLLWAVGKALASADLQLVLPTLHSSQNYHTVSRYLRSGHVDGAVFASMHNRP